YTKLLNKDKKEASLFINNLLTISFIITSILMITCIIFSDQIVYLFASSLSNEGLVLASKMLKIMSITLYFTMFSYICGGMLNSNNKFYIPQLAAIPYNIISILSVMILSKKLDIWALVIGTILGMFVQTIVHLLPLRKINKYKLILNFKDKHLKTLLLLSWPMIITVIFQELNVAVDKNVASGIIIGAISSINYSNRVIGIIYGIFSVSIMTILYSKFNELIINNKKEEVFKLLMKWLIIVLMVTLPVTMISVIFNTEIISILFGRGAFDSIAIAMTSEVYLYYSFSIFSMAANDIILRCYYSQNDSKTPMIITIISVLINIILSITLSKILGLKGIALATSIASNIQTICLLTILKWKNKFQIKEFIINFIKVLFVNVLFFVIIYFLNIWIIIDISLIKLFVVVLIGIVFYILFIYIFNISVFKEMISLIKEKIKR
ncbi:MAG: murein biosynthesis integral membrane protein MurJ, partial [Bacilli bacterium]|nr:murein biosynthesis integral membrane protein MurJ [Bacilli bacterium]